jgi:hypothetical protein
MMAKDILTINACQCKAWRLHKGTCLAEGVAVLSWQGDGTSGMLTEQRTLPKCIVDIPEAELQALHQSRHGRHRIFRPTAWHFEFAAPKLGAGPESAAHFAASLGLLAVGGRRCTVLLQRGQQAVAALDWPSLQLCATQLQEISWEKLHLGNWKDVADAWRDTYSLACLWGSTVAVMAGAPGPQSEAAAFGSPSAGQQHATEEKKKKAADSSSEDAASREALRLLDMALLMGGPLFRGAVERAVDFVERTMEASRRGNVADSSPGHGQPEEAVRPKRRKLTASKQALPPGSLSQGAVPLRERLALETFLVEFMQPVGGRPPSPVVITGELPGVPSSMRVLEASGIGLCVLICGRIAPTAAFSVPRQDLS